MTDNVNAFLKTVRNAKAPFCSEEGQRQAGGIFGLFAGSSVEASSAENRKTYRSSAVNSEKDYDSLCRLDSKNQVDRARAMLKSYMHPSRRREPYRKPPPPPSTPKGFHNL